MPNIKVGSYTGTGAAVNVSLGFTPTYIKIWNATDGDICWEWFNGMGASDALQITNHADTQVSLITANAVDTYAGSGTAAEGFTVGTALSESGDTFRYLAIGDDI